MTEPTEHQQYEPRGMLEALHLDEVEPIEVAPGIVRRSLTESAHATGWLIDFAPGTQWPDVDVHPTEERYFVISGEIIEGSTRFPAGSYVTYEPGSSHRPGSETGAQILGINLA